MNVEKDCCLSNSYLPQSALIMMGCGVYFFCLGVWVRRACAEFYIPPSLL